MATRDFHSSFHRSFRFTNLSSIVSTSPVPILITSTSLLLASSSSLSSTLPEATSFGLLHSFLRKSVAQALTEIILQSTISELIASNELHVST